VSRWFWPANGANWQVARRPPVRDEFPFLFTEHATYRDDADPSAVVHAESLWPGGGGVMFGSRRPIGAVDNFAAAYLATGYPDDVFERAVEAGATVLREMVDHDYGGRGGRVADLEGNHWSFGSYQP